MPNKQAMLRIDFSTSLAALVSLIGMVSSLVSSCATFLAIVFLIAEQRGLLSPAVLLVLILLPVSVFLIAATRSALEVLVRSITGKSGLRVYNDRVAREGEDQIVIMEFSEVKIDSRRRFVTFSNARIQQGYLHQLFPTSVYKETGGRLRVPLFLVSNEEEVVNWIDKQTSARPF